MILIFKIVLIYKSIFLSIRVQTSQQYFHNLIAPDYSGFGNSSMLKVDQFDYTFDRLAEVIEKFTEALGLSKYSLYVKYSLYIMDYGAPIGFRLATKHPERVEVLIVQNGNAYEEGLNEF
jgi:pimeloyl-ACP methyl ester carboxylesterase